MGIDFWGVTYGLWSMNGWFVGLLKSMLFWIVSMTSIVWLRLFVLFCRHRSYPKLNSMPHFFHVAYGWPQIDRERYSYLATCPDDFTSEVRWLWLDYSDTRRAWRETYVLRFYLILCFFEKGCKYGGNYWLPSIVLFTSLPSLYLFSSFVYNKTSFYIVYV